LTEIVLRHSEMLAEEREKAEARSRTVNQELNHRIKNILAVIKSVVAQPTADGDVEAYVAALKGRIEALAYAHDQVMHSSGGALGELIEAEVLPYRAEATILASGPAVVLDARALSIFALICHEMATNAAKYGALSVAGGKLTVTWERRADDACAITWRESGGPRVRQPTRRGFGTVLIVRSLPFDLGGESEIGYPAEGVSARFVIPGRFVTWGEETDRAVAPRPPAAVPVPSPLTGKSVLLLEDEFVIALEAEDMLASLGASAVETCSSTPEALAAIAASPPDCALLDVSLGRETSAVVAARLRELGIPFAFATGYDDGGALRDDFAGTPVIRKPYGRDALAAGLAAAIGPRG
jgi:two-component sensor histidine kinase/CheY-like chemotaxis protein